MITGWTFAIQVEVAVKKKSQEKKNWQKKFVTAQAGSILESWGGLVGAEKTSELNVKFLRVETPTFQLGDGKIPSFSIEFLVCPLTLTHLDPLKRQEMCGNPSKNWIFRLFLRVSCITWSSFIEKFTQHRCGSDYFLVDL